MTNRASCRGLRRVATARRKVVRHNRTPTAQTAHASISLPLNSLFVFLGIESWKPIITALLLPPVPLLLLILVGARLLLPRRGLGWFVILVGVGLLWLSACSGVGQMLTRLVLHPLSGNSFLALQSLLTLSMQEWR